MDTPDTPHPSALGTFSETFSPTNSSSTSTSTSTSRPSRTLTSPVPSSSSSNTTVLSPSSPRLPSPPPPTEIQIGPPSPGGAPREAGPEEAVIEENARRRIHPGTKAAEMHAGPPLVELSELDSAFQLQEHLSALHYHYTHPSSGHAATASFSSCSPEARVDDGATTVPITRQTAAMIAAPPAGVGRFLWLYELCRFLLAQTNSLITGFLADTPPCSALTCPEMRASEWQFLCAVHDQPKSCCAIDYCCHTVDWAVSIVTSQKIFPSRLSLGGEGGGGENGGGGPDDVGRGSNASGKSSETNKGQGVKHLVNIFRRLHRIFAHAWFQHRGVFWEIEGREGLYVLFKTVCDAYELLPAENYKLPPEAEGLDADDMNGSGSAVEEATPTQVLKRDSVVGSLPLTTPAAPTGKNTANSGENPASGHVREEVVASAGRSNTRRHIRQSPSVGSAVTTVIEADEEEGEMPVRFAAAGNEAGNSTQQQQAAELPEQRSRSKENHMSRDRYDDQSLEVPVVVDSSIDAELGFDRAGAGEDSKGKEPPSLKSSSGSDIASHLPVTIPSASVLAAEETSAPSITESENVDSAVTDPATSYVAADMPTAASLPLSSATTSDMSSSDTTTATGSSDLPESIIQTTSPAQSISISSPASTYLPSDIASSTSSSTSTKESSTSTQLYSDTPPHAPKDEQPRSSTTDAQSADEEASPSALTDSPSDPASSDVATTTAVAAPEKKDGAARQARNTPAPVAD